MLLHARLRDFTGFLVGWGYWISCWSGVSAVAVAMTGYLGTLVPVWRALLDDDHAAGHRALDRG